MTEQDRIAHAAIRQTLAACSQAGDARRADAYAACFTEDGVLELRERYEGRSAIRGWMTAPSVIPKPDTPSPGYVSHHLTTCRIELTSATTAKVRTYFLVITAAGLDHSGYYDDRFRAADEGWLLEHRKPRTLWMAEASLIRK